MRLGNAGQGRVLDRWWLPAVLTLVALPALALMPPHVNHTEPKDGGELRGRTVVFHGYSLDYADKKAEAFDVEARRSVHAVVEVSCRWEGKGDCAGCQQQRCEARVTLAAVERGHHYRVSYLDTTVTVLAMDNDRGAPDATPKPVPPSLPTPAPAPKEGGSKDGAGKDGGSKDGARKGGGPKDGVGKGGGVTPKGGGRGP